MSQISFYIRQLLQKMWFLPAAFSLIAVLTVVTAYYMAFLAPDELPFTVPQNAVQSILEILAASLLTVAVFALSTVASALNAASAATTPRAVPLITADRSAQTSISVFIGAFLYSIVGIIGLYAGIYSEAGRLLLFAVTLVVVVLVVTALIRWIGQISAIGRVTQTIDRVELATQKAFDTLSHHALFDCHRLEGEAKGRPINAPRLGYVQHLDAARLQRVAEAQNLTIAVTARPGTYVSPMRALMSVEGDFDASCVQELIDAFTLGDVRTFDSDPRFGLVVLGEIADKALSPGTNDPGTAIDVVGTVTRLLCDWQPPDEVPDPKYDRIYVPPLNPDDLFEDVFRPIARDGAGMVEVVLRLLSGLEVIATNNASLREAALLTARDVYARARLALTAPGDQAALEAAAGFANT